MYTFSVWVLIDLAVRADSSDNRCTWTRAVRSLPYDYDIASCKELTD